MPRLIALARLLFSPLLAILAACGTDGTSYSNRIAADGHDVLYSKARAKDGVARFECKASDSGDCHYTLYPAACGGKADCTLPALRRFTVQRGKVRQLAGIDDFRICVATSGADLGADCQPAATGKAR